MHRGLQDAVVLLTRGGGEMVMDCIGVDATGPSC